MLNIHIFTDSYIAEWMSLSQSLEFACHTSLASAEQLGNYECIAEGKESKKPMQSHYSNSRRQAESPHHRISSIRQRRLQVVQIRAVRGPQMHIFAAECHAEGCS